MKRAVLFLIFLAAVLRLPAQTNTLVRLALVSETDETFTAADILTADLSGNKNLQLLERNEIDRVYREQALSAGNKDYLKLGQILGADGLLLLDVVRTPQSTNLMARFIAVKPGVILTDGSFDWPLKDTAQWAESVSSYLNLLLPKLSVQATDAIPISVVNLRSAVASAEGAETERQLKLLTIQRLSQEKELFVLERQKMQLLSEEKDLKLDDSAFWNGSYLLEGVVDQNGYSKETVTINARLTPPKGGAPLQFEVSASRTNLSEVINQLAEKVNEALKISSTVHAWNAADEAAQYFGEANWALRWGVYSEAQAAADSAWALGKRDLVCALVRVNAYVMETVSHVENLEEGTIFISEGETASAWAWDIKHISDSHLAVVFDKRLNEIDYATMSLSPDPKDIDRAMHALQLYYEFSRTSSDGEPKILSRGEGWNDWHNSDWYNLGIEDLVAASKVLQHFNLVPQLQKPVANKLAELRALARSVAKFISKSPSVHDSYYVGDRIVSHDELSYTIGEENSEHSNIFSCEVAWGCFWQETPEDGVALYRELMSSPVFIYVHNQFWHRNPSQPRLVGWNDEDRKRVPEIWNNFVQELDNSTNVLLRMEGQALAVIDAKNDGQLELSFNTLMDTIFSNRVELVENNVELFYLDWRINDLLFPPGKSYTLTPALDRLQSECRTNYIPKLETMDQEYWSKTFRGNTRKGNLQAYEKQKQYLKENKPFDSKDAPQEFVEMFIFGFKDYTRPQALEIQPLLAAYKSNLLMQVEQLPNQKKGWARIGMMQVGQVEANVSRVLNPSAPSPEPQNQPQPPRLAAVVKTVELPSTPNPTSNVTPEVVTNILTVNRFLEIPLDGLPGDQIDQISDVHITAHHWIEGKLVLDFQYGAAVYSFDAKGNWQQTRTALLPAIAILTPETEHWDVISCSEVDIREENNFYHRTTLWHGELFTSNGGQVKRYDFASHQWQLLPVSDGGNYELFTVNDRLYAANGNIIFEILGGGKSTDILASARRQPPVSVLDTQDLGTPTLFGGPNHSLRVCTKSKILTWVGNDWREDCTAPPASFPPAISPEDVLFRTDGFNFRASISSLATDGKAVEFCLGQKVHQVNYAGFYLPSVSTPQEPEPLWKLPSDLFLANLPAAALQSGLCLLVNNSAVQEIANDYHEVVQEKVVAKDGYNAALLCFSRGLPLPQKLFLKFDAPDGCPPSAGINPGSPSGIQAPPPAWMLFATNFLILGLESSAHSIPAFNGAERIGIGYKAGVWLVPLSQIEPVIAAQKQIQLAQKTQEESQARAAAEQAQKKKEQMKELLLVKYDRNHNGIIDPEEREEALDDPSFIESELDAIDANHNGWLDASELAYFDANTNKILEPKEQAGIEIAQHLLAARLLKQFDVNGDGCLNRQGFNELVQSGPNASARPMSGFSFQSADANYDGKIDLAELEVFLNQQLRTELRPRGAMGADFSRQMIAEPGRKVDAHQSFKAYVELYWHNSATGAGVASPLRAQKVLSDEERQRVLQQLMQKRNAETPP